MIEVKVSAQTAPELTHLVISLARQFGVNLPTAQAELVAEVEGNQVASEVTEKAEVKEEKQKEKKAPKKEKVEAPKEEKAETTNVSGAIAGASFTKQNIADACQKVSAAKNLDAAKAILAQFKNEKGEACRRISDVLEADYGAFVAKCEEAIK